MKPLRRILSRLIGIARAVGHAALVVVNFLIYPLGGPARLYFDRYGHVTLSGSDNDETGRGRNWGRWPY